MSIHEDENTHSFKVLFTTVLMLISVGMVATDVYLPSFPSIKASLGSSSSAIQFTLTLFLFGFAGSQIFYGPLSDRIGRKKVALIGLISSLVGTLICLFAVNTSMLLLGRLLQGLSLGTGSTIASAVMRDVYSGDRLAIFGSFVPLGTATLTAMAPVLGGYIQQHFGWRINFLVIFIYTLLGIAIILKWLPETNKNLNPDATKKSVFIQNYLHLLKSPIFIGYTACGSLAFGGFAAYLTASPFLFQESLGLSPVQYGWLGFILGAGLAFGGVLNGYFLKKFGRHRMLVAGIIVMAIGGILMLILALLNLLYVSAIILPMSLYAMGCASTFANAFAGAFHPFAKIAGFAGALYGCIQILGGSVVTMIVVMLHEKNAIPLGIILTVLSILSYLFQYLAFIRAKKAAFH